MCIPPTQPENTEDGEHFANVSINPICKKDNLEDKSVIYSFSSLFMQCKEKKKQKPMYLQQAHNTLALNPQFFFQQTEKTPSGKIKC